MMWHVVQAQVYFFFLFRDYFMPLATLSSPYTSLNIIIIITLPRIREIRKIRMN